MSQLVFNPTTTESTKLCTFSSMRSVVTVHDRVNIYILYLFNLLPPPSLQSDFVDSVE